MISRTYLGPFVFGCQNHTSLKFFIWDVLACFLRNVKYKSSNTYSSSTYVRLLHNPLVKEGPILLFTIDFCALKQKLKLRSVRSIVLYLESQQCMNVRCAASDVGWLLELLGA